MPIPPALMKHRWEAIEKARAAGPKTDRERGFVDAMEVYYKDFDKTDYGLLRLARRKSLPSARRQVQNLHLVGPI